VTVIEFWPEYGDGPLWEDGRAVDLQAAGLPAALVGRLRSWNDEYGDERLPIDGPGDAAWIAEGRALLSTVREAVGPQVEVIVTEPWWGEAAAPGGGRVINSQPGE